MRRRTWLNSVGLGTAWALAPGWLREAFAFDARCPPAQARRESVAAALAAARASGRPLLVLTVPTDGVAVAIRGNAFGEWLNTGPDAALADLSQVDLVCASTPHLQAEVEGVRDGEPVMRLIEGDSVRVLDGEVPAGDAEAIIDQRVALLSKLLGDALAGTADVRAANVLSRLSAADQARLRGPVGALEAPLVARGAAWLARSRGDEAGVQKLLAASARQRHLRLPVPGSLWGVSTGCGAMVEDPEHPEQILAMPCGMGHVPERSRRFVRFYTDCAPN